MELRAELSRELNALGAPKYGGVYAPFTKALISELSMIGVQLDLLSKESAVLAARLPQMRFGRIQRKARTLFGEALGLRMAECVRKDLDNGMCAIADRLLSEFARAVTLEIPLLSTVAESEFFGASTRIVRLRYPTNSIWDLPVLGHEFAHSFGPLWYWAGAPDEHPRQSFVRNSRLGTRLVSDEYFCDLMGTFLLGPSYALMCILDRFDPTASEDTETHPSDVKRAWWVLRGLELLGGELPNGDDREEYKEMACELRELWTAFTKDSGADSVTDNDVAALELAIQSLFPQMSLGLPIAAYKCPRIAWGLVADYKETPKSSSGDRIPVVGVATHRQASPRTDIRDVLNAAWLLRRENKNGDLAHIDAWARGLAGSVSQ